MILELLKKHDVISFDVFDTLLTRKFSSPFDIFTGMEKKVVQISGGQFKNFAYIRRRAENEAALHFKSQGINEVTLDEIYNEISEITNLPQEILEEIKVLELKVESESCIIRQEGYALYNKALALHKDIVLISDMYLPFSFIENQLERHGITHYIKLYLSSDYREKKHDGALFKIFLEESALKASAVLHIGDNPAGDIEAAKKLGISTHYLPKAMENFKSLSGIYEKDKTRSKSLVAKLIADSYFDRPNKDKPTLENLGFCALGPMVTSFVAWLYREAKRDGIKTLYFCSRDALIFKKAFDIMYGDEIRSEYLKISRHIARLHDLKSRSALLSFAQEPIFATTIGDYLNYRFGLEEDDVPLKILQKHGVTGLDFRIGGKFNREVLGALLLDLEPLIFKSAARKTKLYGRYLKAIKFGAEKSGIVDFGYSGTSQCFLSETTELDITGYYYQTFAKILNAIQEPNLTRSYHSPYISGNGDDFISKNRFILETLICSDEDSFKHVEPQGTSRNRFDFIHFKSSHDEVRKNVVCELHEATLNFIKKLKAREPDLTRFALDMVSAESQLTQFLTNPSPNDVELMAGVAFEDLYGPQLPRYIFPPLSDARTINPSQILWKAGHALWLADQAKPSTVLAVKAPPIVPQLIQKPITIDQQGHVIEPTPTFIGKILLQTEQRLVKQRVSNNKYIKYSTNRLGFFEDTQIKAAKVYYNLIGKKLM